MRKSFEYLVKYSSCYSKNKRITKTKNEEDQYYSLQRNKKMSSHERERSGFSRMYILCGVLCAAAIQRAKQKVLTQTKHIFAEKLWHKNINVSAKQYERRNKRRKEIYDNHHTAKQRTTTTTKRCLSDVLSSVILQNCLTTKFHISRFDSSAFKSTIIHSHGFEENGSLRSSKQAS